MKIILFEKIYNLGNVGEQVFVKPGYARNFLFPRKKALLATKKNIELFKIKHLEFEKKLNLIKINAQNRAKKILDLGSVTIKSYAGSEGKLFGSIQALDIANTISAEGIKVYKKEIILPNGNIRYIGSYEIKIKVYNDIFAKIILNVINKK